MKNHKQNLKRILSLVLVFAILFAGSSFVFASHGEKKNSLGDSSLGDSSTLGASIASDLEIFTAHELQDFAKKVNDGTDYSGKLITLEANLSLEGLEDWEAIGTKKHPFSGTFDGKEHVVSGLGKNEETLFGHLKKASVKNLTLYSYHPKSASETFGGLYLSMEESSFENCFVYTLLETKASARFVKSSIAPIFGWYEDNPTATDFHINKEGELLGLAELVNRQENPVDFKDTTIHLHGSFNLKQVQNWEPIGTSTRPFRGTLEGVGEGATIRELSILAAARDNIGFVGYMEGGSLTNISILNATVIGRNNVGVLAGNLAERTTADVTVPDFDEPRVGTHITEVRYCNTSGYVSGNHNIGGLVGKSYNNDIYKGRDLMPEPEIEILRDAGECNIRDSFSSADVAGVRRVGGLVGAATGYRDITTLPQSEFPPDWEIIPYPHPRTHTSIRDCFATGNVSATVEAGGLAGFTECTGIVGCASSGSVTASGRVGGLVGNYEKNFDNPHTWTYNIILGSYTSSSVYGISMAGGLGGTYTEFAHSYSSGKVVVPSLDPGFSSYAGSYVSFWVGWGAMGQYHYFADPNGLHTYEYPNNVGADVENDRFKNAYYDPTYPNLSEISWFDEVGPRNDDDYIGNELENPFYYLQGFDFDGLTYTGDPNNITSAWVPTAGSYPTMRTFHNHPLASYRVFSELTTKAEYRTVPLNFAFYHDGDDGYAAQAGENQAYVFPALPEGTHWRIGGSESYILEDPTLVDGDGLPIGNTFTFVENGDRSAVLKVDYPLSEETPLPISIEVSDVPGMEIKYDITMEDNALRHKPDSQVLRYADDTLEAAKESDKYFGITEKTVLISFDEAVALNDGSGNTNFQVAMYKYKDGEFNQPATSPTVLADAKIVGQKAVQITLPTGADAIGYDESWRIEFSSLNGTQQTVQDLNESRPNVYEQDIFFKVRGNQVISFSFNPNHPIVTSADDGSTTTTKHENDTQIIYMEENASHYGGGNSYLLGIEQKNETPANIYKPGFATIETKTIAPLAGYPNKDNITLFDFYQYAGEHVITYQMPDPEQPELLSEPITRTFRIHSPVKVLQNGSPNINVEGLTISKEEAQSLHQQRDKINIREMVENTIAEKYLAKGAKDRITAVQYDYQGKAIEKSITVNAKGVSAQSLLDGYKQAIALEVEDGPTLYTVLTIEGILPDVQIQLGKDSGQVFTTQNRNVTRKDIAEYFQATAVKRSDGSPVDTPVFYNIKNLRRGIHSNPQTIEIYLPEYQDHEYQEVREATRLEVDVVFEKYIPYKHSEDKEETLRNYWDNLMHIIRESPEEKTHQRDINYEAGTAAPSDFFLVVANQKGNTTLEFPSGISLTVPADTVNKGLIPKTYTTYPINVEPMYNLYITRDAAQEETQQFYTAERVELPATVTITVPLEDKLPEKGLTLYLLNQDTHQYEKIRNLTRKEMEDSQLRYETDVLEGMYIISSAKLDQISATVPKGFTPEPIRVIDPTKES